MHDFGVKRLFSEFIFNARSAVNKLCFKALFRHNSIPFETEGKEFGLKA
jgi:hypothetical protein